MKRKTAIVGIALVIALPSTLYAYQRSLSRKSLFAAARGGDTSEVLRQIKSHPDLLNAQDEWGFTPLKQAALYHHVDTVKAFLDAGADKSFRDYNANFTALDDAPAQLAMFDPKWRKLQEDFMKLQGQPAADIAAQMAKIDSVHTPKDLAETQAVIDLLDR